MSTAREATTQLVALLRREHQCLADFLVALAAFDAEGRWSELGYKSLFDFLRRELGLSAGAAQNRRTAAALVRLYPDVEAALREGRLCLSSICWVAKVLTPENAPELLPRFFGLSAREAEFVAVSIRPVANPPRREFLVTAVRRDSAAETKAAAEGTADALCLEATRDLQEAMGNATKHEGGRLHRVAPQRDGAAAVSGDRERDDVTRGAFHACETDRSMRPEQGADPASGHAAAILDRPRIRPLDAERARVNMTVSRRLLAKLAAARDALSHSHPGATEETILEVGLDLIIERHRKRRGIGARPAARTTPDATSLATHGETSQRSNGRDGDRWAAAANATATSSSIPTPTSAGAMRQGERGFRQSSQTAGPAPGAAPMGLLAGATAESRGARLAPEPTVAVSIPLPPRRPRHVPAHVWRAVWARDGGRCVWPIEGGGVCGSTHRLELDHVDGWALGAPTTTDACRLLCRHHQRVSARKLYGDAVVDRYLLPRSGDRCSESVEDWEAPPRRYTATGSASLPGGTVGVGWR